MTRLLRYFCAALMSFACYSAIADQFMITNASEAKALFWNKLYPNSAWTLYCGDFIENKSRGDIEHIYSLHWVARALKCGDIDQCEHNNARFNRIAADLHNLYPARPMIIRARKDFQFGQIPGEFREFFECDFESSKPDKVVEPREVARGNIARAIFYMHTQYELPISETMLKHLKQWNLADPPSKDEYRRNDAIELLQGTRNPFIDNPKMAQALLNNSTTTTTQREVDINFLESF